MQRTRISAALLLALPLLAGCYDNDPLNAPDLSTSNGLMARYVSMGNSITAGYQSAGINDSTQQRSYAVLFAGRANAPFFVPSLQGRGCAPPLTNNVTGDAGRRRHLQHLRPAGRRAAVLREQRRGARRHRLLARTTT